MVENPREFLLKVRMCATLHTTSPWLVAEWCALLASVKLLYLEVVLEKQHTCFILENCGNSRVSEEVIRLQFFSMSVQNSQSSLV